MASKCLKVLIMGAPGSGKGTISKRIVKDFKLTFISTGDLLRQEVSSRSEIGIACENLLKRGELVPDATLDDLLFEVFATNSNGGWLLDGYPRKVSQASTLYKRQFVPDTVIDLQVPFTEIINRLKDRWVHQPSGRIYNLQYNRPKVEGRDDVTGEPLTQRSDDQPDTVLTRLNDYQKSTMPVLDFFREKGKLATFHGSESDVIWPEVRKYLIDFNPKEISSLG